MSVTSLQIGGDGRKTGQQRFRHRVAEALCERRERKHIRHRMQSGHVLTEPEELRSVSDSRPRSVLPQFRCRVSFSSNPEFGRGLRRTQYAKGVDQNVMSLLSRQSADTKDDARAGLPLRVDRRAWPRTGQGDSIRNHNWPRDAVERSRIVSRSA